MASVLHPSFRGDRPAPAGPLALLADVAARMAQSPPLEELVPSVLRLVRSRLRADECVVWTLSADGLTRRWADGDVATRAAEVGGLLGPGVRTGGPLAAVRLRCGERQLGALTVRLGRSLTADERSAFSAVGNMLVPALLQAEVGAAAEPADKPAAIPSADSRRFIETIVDALPFGLYVIDREYRIQAWNRKRETGTQGVSREEALGRTIFEVLHRQPAESLRAEFDEVFRSGRMEQFEVDSTAGGEERTYRISRIPMRMGDASVTHVITVGEDVTEWKRAAERMARSEHLAAVGQLAAGVLEDVTEPLSSIGTWSESVAHRLAADDTSKDDAICRGHLAAITREVEHCRRVVAAVLDLSNPRPEVTTTVDPTRLVDDAVHYLRQDGRYRKLQVRKDVDRSSGARVLGSADGLLRALSALLFNAADVTDERREVVVRMETPAVLPPCVRIEVEDTGPGMTSAVRRRMFDPFFSTKPLGRGAGLGLTVCRRIVESHGGRIEVDTAEGEGTTIAIVLPVFLPGTAD